jgi:hypothetical protein
MFSGSYSPPPETVALLEKIHSLVAKATRKAQLHYVLDQTGPLKLQAAFPQAVDVGMVFESLKLLFTYYYAPADGRDHRDLAKAKAVALAALAMGRQFTDERRLAAMVVVGIEIQKQATGLLQTIYDSSTPKPGDQAVIAACESYGRELGDLFDFYVRKLEIVHDEHPAPGDIFNLAENDQDLAWRVQGVLELGLVKFVAGKRGDKRRVAELINKFKHDSDPLIVSAADAADKFTKADFDAYRPPSLDDSFYWPAGMWSQPD